MNTITTEVSEQADISAANLHALQVYLALLEQRWDVAECIGLLDGDPLGKTIILMREGSDFVEKEISAKSIDLGDLSQYEMIYFDGGDREGAPWKQVFFPNQYQSRFLNERPLPKVHWNQEASMPVLEKQGLYVVYSPCKFIHSGNGYFSLVEGWVPLGNATTYTHEKMLTLGKPSWASAESEWRLWSDAFAANQLEVRHNRVDSQSFA